MAIYCSKCGKEHPDDALFCMKCGKPLTAAAQTSSPSEPQWEYCEVVYQTVKMSGWFSNGTVRFWAKAIGPNGEYSAGQSADIALESYPTFPHQSQAEVVSTYNAFIGFLSRNGWILLPSKGDEWFSSKFRRKVS
ncbi:MAG TPA: zinc-ribbon domain-containing protein [Ktedonobacterales bacterium]|jgi:hypothetical protein